MYLGEVKFSGLCDYFGVTKKKKKKQEIQKQNYRTISLTRAYRSCYFLFLLKSRITAIRRRPSGVFKPFFYYFLFRGKK